MAMSKYLGIDSRTACVVPVPRWITQKLFISCSNNVQYVLYYTVLFVSIMAFERDPLHGVAPSYLGKMMATHEGFWVYAYHQYIYSHFLSEATETCREVGSQTFFRSGRRHGPAISGRVHNSWNLSQAGFHVISVLETHGDLIYIYYLWCLDLQGP